MLLECVKCICVGSESTPSQDTTETLMNIYVTFLNLVSSGCWFFAVVLINTSLQHQHRAGLHYSSSVVGLQVEQKQATESWKGLLLFFFFLKMCVFDVWISNEPIQWILQYLYWYSLSYSQTIDARWTQQARIKSSPSSEMWSNLTAQLLWFRLSGNCDAFN